MTPLLGKVALVTGAGGYQGIGRAIALRLARDGADVAVNDLALSTASKESSWGGLTSVVDEIKALGRRSIPVVGDVSDAASVEGMFQTMLEHFGQIDILVNNAASRPGRDRALVVDLDPEAWDQVQKVNVRGSFLCCRSAARAMIKRGKGGKIILLSSTKGRHGAIKHAAYAASKFAVLGLMQSLALELAPHKINVNAICPGVVDTERLKLIADALETGGDSPGVAHAKMLEQSAAVNPLGRVAQAEDIAKAAAFLASNESDYVTGEALMVSGGSVIF